MRVGAQVLQVDGVSVESEAAEVIVSRREIQLSESPDIEGTIMPGASGLGAVPLLLAFTPIVPELN